MAHGQDQHKQSHWAWATTGDLGCKNGQQVRRLELAKRMAMRLGDTMLLHTCQSIWQAFRQSWGQHNLQEESLCQENWAEGQVIKLRVLIYTSIHVDVPLFSRTSPSATTPKHRPTMLESSKSLLASEWQVVALDPWAFLTVILGSARVRMKHSSLNSWRTWTASKSRHTCTKVCWLYFWSCG